MVLPPLLPPPFVGYRPLFVLETHNCDLGRVVPLYYFMVTGILPPTFFFPTVMDSEIGTTPGQANPSPSRITRKNGLFGLGFAWLVGCEPGTADDCFV